VESKFDLRTEAYKLFGVDVTQIPGLETNVPAPISSLAEISPDGPPPVTLSPGVLSRTTTSAEDGSCGEACAKPTTARVKSSARRAVLTSQSHAHRRIPTTSQSQARPRRRYPPPPPARSPPCSTSSSPAKSNSTTLSGTPRRSASKTNPSSTHAASSSTRLPTRSFGGLFLNLT